VVLMTAAGGENGAVGKFFQKTANRFRSIAGIRKEIEPEFEEGLTRLGFAPGVFKQGSYFRQAQRDANARERPYLRHRRVVIQDNMRLQNAPWARTAGLILFELKADREVTQVDSRREARTSSCTISHTNWLKVIFGTH